MRYESRAVWWAIPLVALSAGCVSFRGGDDLPRAPIARTASAPPLSYELTWTTFGTPNPGGAKDALPPLEEELRESGAFADVKAGSGTPYHLDVKVNNSGNLGVALLLGTLSGLTLTILPGYARDDYEMVAVLTKNGSEVKRYRYEESVSTWTEFFLVFGMPFNHRGDKVPDTIRNMTRHLVKDMVQDGVLSDKAG